MALVASQQHQGEVLCCLCGLFCNNESELLHHVATRHPVGGGGGGGNCGDTRPPAKPPTGDGDDEVVERVVVASDDVKKPAFGMPASLALPLLSRNVLGGKLPTFEAAAEAFFMPFNALIAQLAIEAFTGRQMGAVLEESSEQPENLTIDAAKPLPPVVIAAEPACQPEQKRKKVETLLSSLPCSKKQDHQARTDGKNYQCTYCGKYFRLKQTLLVHKRVHTGERPYQCPICPARFSHATNRASHVRTHTKQRPFQCDICDRRFTRKFSLSLHKLRHNNTFLFQCEVCDKRFRRTDLYRNHMVGHVNGFRYTCTYCSTKFSTKTSLKKHTTKEHPLLL